MDKFRVQGPTTLGAKSQFPAPKRRAADPVRRSAGRRTGRDPKRSKTERRGYVDEALSQLGAKVERNGSVHIDASRERVLRAL